MTSGNHIIPRSFNDMDIDQRVGDGYFNATAMCKACGKQWNDYARSSTTKAFIEALSSETGYPVSELIQSVKGGNPQLQGTWVHPQIAANLAQWLSPKFAVRVSQWIIEELTQRSGPQVGATDPAELLEMAARAIREQRDQNDEVQSKLIDVAHSERDERRRFARENARLKAEIIDRDQDIAHLQSHIDSVNKHLWKGMKQLQERREMRKASLGLQPKTEDSDLDQVVLPMKRQSNKDDTT